VPCRGWSLGPQRRKSAEAARRHAELFACARGFPLTEDNRGRHGVMWVMLPLAFEISLDRFVLDYSWERLASDERLLKGGSLPIGLAAMAMSPLIALRFRGVHMRRGQANRYCM